MNGKKDRMITEIKENAMRQTERNKHAFGGVGNGFSK